MIEEDTTKFWLKPCMFFSQKKDLFSIDIPCVALGGLIRVIYCIVYPVPVRDSFKYKEFIELWDYSGIIPGKSYYPPLSIFILKIPYSLFGYDVIKGGTIINIVLGLGIIIALIKIAYALFPSKAAALCSGILVATHPTLIHYSCQMTRENSYLFFSCLATYFFIKSLTRTSKLFYVAYAAIFSSCALLCRFEALELFAIFVLWITFSNLKSFSKGIKKLFLFISFSIISFGSIVYIMNVPFSYFLSGRYLKKFDFILNWAFLQ